MHANIMLTTIATEKMEKQSKNINPGVQIAIIVLNVLTKT